ncbi:hypothetical protein [Fischerella thermalis]|nr:hypothetical protein [Fischerella thermalis]
MRSARFGCKLHFPIAMGDRTVFFTDFEKLHPHHPAGTLEANQHVYTR